MANKYRAELHLLIEGRRIGELYNEIARASELLEDTAVENEAFAVVFPILEKIKDECLQTAELANKINENGN